MRADFDDERNRRSIEKLHAAGVRLAGGAAGRPEGPLEGLTFVVTGTLSSDESRSEAEARIRALGGKVGSA